MVSLITDKVTFAITPTPTDASVSINGVVGTSIKTYKGATVNWVVSKSGYKTQRGTEVVTAKYGLSSFKYEIISEILSDDEDNFEKNS